MEKEPEDYIKAVKEWILTKKESMYNEFLKTETGKSTDLTRYEDEVSKLGYQLLKAIRTENVNELSNLGWPKELMDCIREPSVNVVIHDFIQLACLRFPNSNSIYILKYLKEKNIGLE